MVRQYVLLLAIVALAMTGCTRKPNPNAPFAKIQPGMTLEAAKPLVDGEAEEVSDSNLPASPKPREIYSKLPTSVVWHVWSAPGKPMLILGTIENKIVFKQVFWTQDGERKGDATALPEYQ